MSRAEDMGRFFDSRMNIELVPSPSSAALCSLFASVTHELDVVSPYITTSGVRLITDQAQPETRRFSVNLLLLTDLNPLSVCHGSCDPEAILTDEAGYWPHKAAEQFLKAYLLSNGWIYRRIDDLEVLLNEATDYRRDLSRYCSACRKISGYHIADRYLLADGSLLTVEDVLNSREDIKPLFDCIHQELS
jgi:HEPN domain-containing protein